MIKIDVFVKMKVIGQENCESDRLISNIIEMYDILDIPGYVVTMDIEKAFDSFLDHDFLLNALKKLVFLKISYTG